jgi:hypothetical protein
VDIGISKREHNSLQNNHSLSRCDPATGRVASNIDRSYFDSGGDRAID